MGTNKDLYTILGVSKDVSEKDLKSAYRKLAKTWHPDKFGDKPEKEKKEAEEKFKEITEAYNILSDKGKRQQYDMFGTVDGSTSGGRWSNTNADDIFRDFMGGNPFGDFGSFGGFGRTHHSTENKGTDKKIRISVTLEDIYYGNMKDVTYEVERPCSTCGGSGSKSGSSATCPYCNGTGFITKVQHFMGGYSQQTSPCPHCGGTGTYVQDPCDDCHGTGVKNEKIQRGFKVPTIDKMGLTYKMALEGNSAHNNNGTNGDLYFTFALKEEPNSKFHIDETNYANICTDVEVSVIDCLTGCEKIVESLGNHRLKIKIPKGTMDGQTFSYNGYGFKLSNGSVGNLKVRVKMTMPKLSDEQIEKIKVIVNDK